MKLNRKFLVIALIAIIALSFSAFQQSTAATGTVFLGSFSTSINNPHFADVAVSVASVSGTGVGTGVLAYTNYCLGCNTLTVSNIALTSGQMYLVEASINGSSSAVCVISDTDSLHFSPITTSQSSSGHATACSWNYGVIPTTGTDAVTVGTGTSNYDMQAYVYVLTGYQNATGLSYNSATDSTCSCSPTIVQLFFNYITGSAGSFASAVYDSAAVETAGLQYEVGTTGLGQASNVPFGGEYITYGSGYYTSTHVYSIGWTNSQCLNHPVDCTNETTVTTDYYDATSTVITITYCSTSDSGGQYCYVATTSTNVTATYTSVGYSTSTVTTTLTATAIVAPGSTSLLNWFFGFALLIIPPAAFIGMFRGRGSTDLTTPLMVGLFVGALLSLLINILVSGVGFAVIAFVFIWLWRSGKL